jgi:type II secretory ATPase GspE/PulE/Tfp pilus assembly ATPase PilB-like protein
MEEPGVSIPRDIADYVLLVNEGGHVVLSIATGVESHTATQSLLRSIKNRIGDGPGAFKSYRVESIEQSALPELRRRYQKPSYQSGSGERVVAQLLRDALDLGASDIHLKQYQNAAAILLRVDGDMVVWREGVSKGDIENHCHTLWTMSDGSSKKGNYVPKVAATTSIVFNLDKYGLSTALAAVRCLFAYTFLGPECSIRLQPAGQTARPIDHLGLSFTHIALIRNAVASTGGACFISGPLGSGKSNLLASTVLDYHRLFPGKRIVTIEDPVEIFIADQVSQWAVTGQGEDRVAEYKELLMQSLRADAQMLMNQECRDFTTASIFLEAAITGAIAITTIHTPDAFTIIQRLAGWGIDKVTLTSPSIIRLLGAVRLVPVLCEGCKIPIRRALSDGGAELQEKTSRLQRFANRAFALRHQPVPVIADGHTRNPEGCPACRKGKALRKSYGVTGRTQLAEMILPDNHLLDILYGGDHAAAHRYVRGDLKIPSLREDAILRIAAGRLCPIDAEQHLGLFDDHHVYQPQLVGAGAAE